MVLFLFKKIYFQLRNVKIQTNITRIIIKENKEKQYCFYNNKKIIQHNRKHFYTRVLSV